MKCSFCGKELERGTQECPYCHCRIEAEVQVLRPEERDTFDGVTIEQDGNSESGACGRCESRAQNLRAEYSWATDPCAQFWLRQRYIDDAVDFRRYSGDLLLFAAYIFDFCRNWRSSSIYYAAFYVK